MPIAYVFWALMIVWVIFGPGYVVYSTTPNPRIVSGSHLVLLALLALLGYQVFGAAVK